ncbi:MAG: hypothetical protein H7Y12_05760 [Sphingobacteriaceae bacterium]|nr:hypothetical protein [Cytophagaceae bacterium]
MKNYLNSAFGPLFSAGTLLLGVALLNAPTAQAQQASAAEQPIQWSPAPTFNVHVRSLAQSPKFVVAVNNPEGKAFDVVVRDEAGQVKYEETIRRELKFGRVYNLTTLADGKYTFVVRNGRQHYTQTFAISSNTDRLVTKLGTTSPALPTPTANPTMAAVQEKP